MAVNGSIGYGVYALQCNKQKIIRSVFNNNTHNHIFIKSRNQSITEIEISYSTFLNIYTSWSGVAIISKNKRNNTVILKNSTTIEVYF